ncbi:DJ-1/PfpI family protein [Burkholderia sp. Bp9143]|uniref:DJ-1/PfpI family protein n=1 Tax=Burkholderia sp. Bp9143 TaxID=2184574 RepID=UPI001C8AD238|nr:DJ-1/PfpI family protein [Burkholderia sp. Bp9143]
MLDFTGPHQFLTRLSNARVIAASMGGRAVKADGLVFEQLSDLQEIEHCDVLCVPGGAGVCQALEDDCFIDLIGRLGSGARYVTSVCSGSLILGAAGLLVGKRSACHWSWRDMLPLFGAIPDEARIARDGNVITGGGVTAGIDFALALIAELRGEHQAQAIQLALEYAPAPPFNAGRPELAPPAVLSAVLAERAGRMAANRTRVERVASQRTKHFSEAG